MSRSGCCTVELGGTFRPQPHLPAASHILTTRKVASIARKFSICQKMRSRGRSSLGMRKSYWSLVRNLFSFSSPAPSQHTPCSPDAHTVPSDGSVSSYNSEAGPFYSCGD